MFLLTIFLKCDIFFDDVKAISFKVEKGYTCTIIAGLISDGAVKLPAFLGLSTSLRASTKFFLDFFLNFPPACFFLFLFFFFFLTSFSVYMRT